MPFNKIYGEKILPANCVSITVPANPTPQGALPPIQLDKHFRNGLPPSANAQNAMHAATMQALLYRSKEMFGHPGWIQGVPTSYGAGDRVRWRFAGRTGAYSHAVGVVAVMVPQSSGDDVNAYSRLDLYSDATETTLIASRKFFFGANPSSTTTALPQWREFITLIDGIPPDTTIYGRFTDVDYGRLLCASVFDLQSATEGTDGYLTQNMSAMTPITDIDTSIPADITRNLWTKGGAKVLTWSVNSGTAITTTSSTAKNVIDVTSTAVSSSTPGYTLDMTNKARSSQTSGVPCVMQVFGHIAGASTGGRVYLKDSGGSTVASIVDQWTSTTPTWKSVAFNLPASVDKYDLQFATVGGVSAAEFSLFAVSIYELD